MERITQGMLERQTACINEIKGIKDVQYNTIGGYLLDYAYGGVSLYEVINEHGGVNDVFSCGHVPKRELFNRICAYLKGMRGE